MIRHFFLDKTNTIIKGSHINTGLNPILHIVYGKNIMRGLLHFDISPIQKLIFDKTFSDLDKLKFTLNMTNCFYIDGFDHEKHLIRIGENTKRACSFDLLLLKLPCDFDMGRGYDFTGDFWVKKNPSFSNEGSNWYNSKSIIKWNDGILHDNPNISNGVYTDEFISNEFEKYLKGEKSIVVGTQHFDFGNENLKIDITNYVLNCENNTNYGLMLCFAPCYENTVLENNEYVGFFTDSTNTFFHPYIEATYNEYILDHRNFMPLSGKGNLYLYSFDNGIPVNLDKIPTMEIDGKTQEVKQVTKGVYLAQISPKSLNLSKDTIYYDKWSKIEYNGEIMDDIEMEFITKNSDNLIVGNFSKNNISVVPTLYGINDDEKINRDEIREISIDFRKKYSTNEKIIIDSAEYKLYVKDGDREIDVIDYQPIEIYEENNYFIIYANDLIPNYYHIDIKLKIGREIKYFKDALKFYIKNNITEKYK